MNEDAIILLLERLPEHEASFIVEGLDITARARQAFKRIASTRYARSLLERNLPRRSIAYQVAARYDVSPSTAHARIRDALDMGKRPSVQQTPGLLHDGSQTSHS